MGSYKPSKASITFKMCIPNGSTFVRKADYNQSQDEYCIPFPTNFLRLDEAQMELYKIRRGYIMYYLVLEFCKKLPIKYNHPAMDNMVGYFCLLI